MPTKIEILQEAERRGLLNDEKKALLLEARRRGLAPFLKGTDEFKDKIQQEITSFKNEPGFFKPGGALDTRVLSGQLPLAGAIGGGTIGAMSTNPLGGFGAPVGAGLGGAGGQAIQNNLRRALGFDGTPKSIGGEFANVGQQAMTSARDEMLGQIVAKPVNASLGWIKRGIETTKLPKYGRRLVEGIPFLGKGLQINREMEEEAAKTFFNAVEGQRKNLYDAGVAELKDTFRVQEAARKAAFKAQRDIAKQGVKLLPDSTGAALRVDAGSNLANAINKADSYLSEEISKVIGPAIQKHSKDLIPLSPIKKQIESVLRANGLVDDAGNILTKEVQNILSPERKALAKTLISLNDNLVKAPSLSSTSKYIKGLETNVFAVNRAIKDLQSLANFNSITRTAEQKAYGSLSHGIKESLYDGLEQIAGQEAVGKIRAARQTFSSNQPLFDTLRGIADKAPEQIIDAARNALPGTFINEVIAKQPALKKPIADVVVNDIARSFNSPRSVQVVLDKYGRDSLKKLLEPATYNALLRAEQNLTKSFQPFERSLAPVPIPFQPGSPPAYKLSPFWQKRIAQISRGEVLSEKALRGLFHAIGKSGFYEETLSQY